MVALSFDDVLQKYVGEFGVYQRLLYAAVAVIASGTAVHNLVHAFAAAAPAFTCRDANDTFQDANTSSSSLSCEIANAESNSTQFCENGWIYDQSQYKSTIVTEVSRR